MKKLLAMILSTTLLVGMCFGITGCNDKKLTKDEEMIIANVEYWSEWNKLGYYHKNVQVVGTPKICKEYPIVEITVSFEFEEITAGGYQFYEVGETYQMINHCFYEACTVYWVHENSDGSTENRSAEFRQYQWLQEYDWEKAHWNKPDKNTLTFEEMNVDVLKINERLADFIEDSNQAKRKYEK